MPTIEKVPKIQSNPDREAPLTVAGRVSRHFAELRNDIRAVREQRREAREAASPEERRRRRLLGAAAGTLLMAGAYLTMKYDFPALPALANMRNTQRTKEDRLGTAKVLRDTMGSVAVRTRATLARPAAEHGRMGSRRRIAAMAASALLATNLQPIAPAAEKADYSPVPVASSPVHFGRQLGVTVSPGQKAEEQPVHSWRIAQSGDGASRWAAEMLDSAGLEATPGRVDRVADSIVSTNPGIANDPQHWMNQGDAYDVAPAQDVVQDITEYPPR
jgi:hypothetical protein